MRKKILTFVMALAMVFAVAAPVGAAQSASTVQWKGQSDKDVAVNVGVAQNDTRKNASGAKITSNAHSADFPGIYFIWDSKQKDNGYLKVDAAVFDKYESFVLTSKEANTYWDFAISVQDGQQMTADGAYVFFIPRAQNNKNINMVFIGEYKEKVVESVPVNLGFIGCYEFEGKALTTSFYWQNLAKPGDKIDWAAVDAAYQKWVDDGGLAPSRVTWQTSGGSSFTFDDYANIGYGDFTAGQIESYYGAYYVDPGCGVVASYDRYQAYVEIWNDLWTDKVSGVTAEQKALLSASGGLDHYYALLAHYGATSLPNYYHFDASMKAVYDQWADALEPGLKSVCGELGIDLDAYVRNHESNK
ncbi:hypothetical protein FWG95_00655 [Candidatus Saccharibacteria bacterium]|nr:hypothetical protein [Candidatus Saccharibacteria bacterium]